MEPSAEQTFGNGPGHGGGERGGDMHVISILMHTVHAQIGSQLQHLDGQLQLQLHVDNYKLLNLIVNLILLLHYTVTNKQPHLY